MSAPGPEVLVSLSSFGATEVRRHGQAWFAALAAEAGADGVEVRGELLNDAQAELPAIAALAAVRGLSLVYSSPEGLWDGQGALDQGALARGLVAAQALGAGRLKMAIGGYGPGSAASLPLLAQQLAAGRVELVIENDQTERAGTLAALQAFFEQAGAAGLALGMTFDMGNWHWTGEDPLQAAARCAPRVRYVHCKGVQRESRQWAAVPLAASAAPWRAILRGLPREVPRAIEYPLQGEDLLAVTCEQLELLRSVEVVQ